jgi:hypothetical protein
MRFFNYYEPRGWVDAKGDKIEDWRKKIIEWEKNGKNNRRNPNRPMTAAEYEASGGGRPSPDQIEKFMDWADDGFKGLAGEEA